MVEYHNLTQDHGERVCYFRSTDIEQKNWKRLLWSVPDEFLYLLSKGQTITIIDRSTKPRNKIERVFVPVLQDVLNHIYSKDVPKHNNLKYHFGLAMVELHNDPLLMTKFMFWKKFITDLKIEARTIQVDREANPLQ